MTVVNLHNDTCDIAYLDGDSLVLSSDGASRSYYKKKNIGEVNKKAKKIADQLSKKALEQTE